jgi:hypothetical protein
MRALTIWTAYGWFYFPEMSNPVPAFGDVSELTALRALPNTPVISDFTGPVFPYK